MPSWTKEQTEAIEKSGSNIIVSAGAGSGKTAVLSERVIFKLNSGIHVDELLILTFTRAAAEEMKDRIRKKIKKDSNLKGELDILESAYITTFDSFALSVVKKYHYLLNIPKSIEITDDSIVKLEKKKIMDRVFDSSYEEPKESFSNLIKRFSLKNDTMLKNSLLVLAEKVEGFTDKDEYLKFLKQEFFGDENLDAIVNSFLTYVDELKKNLSLELEKTYLYFDETFNSKLDEALLPIINSKNLDELIARKDVKFPRVPNGTDDDAKKVKEDLKKALEDLLAVTIYGNEEKIKTDILSTESTTLSIVELLERFYAELKSFKEKNGIYTFGDVANLAIKILRDQEDARLELKNKFKEIMIDEYQDTNDIQETFIGLIANNNVYMVGDIKQSIYRFRGSNPSIFKTKYDDYSKNLNGYKIDLIKNFRSREEVLDNINRIFDLLMDDNLGGAAYTVSHEMVYGNTSYDTKKMSSYDYNFEVLEYADAKETEFTNIEAEIFTIGNDIKKKIDSRFQVFDKDTNELRPFKYSDAVIILDRSRYFDDFKRIFEYLSIPLTILKDENLSSSIDILLLKNIIDLIIRIQKKDFKVDFKYDLLSIGRSFLYEYTDEYLFTLITENTFQESTLYQDFQKLDDYNSMTIREFLIKILDTTKYFDKISLVGDYENRYVRISKIVDMASSLGSMGYTIEDFKDYLDEIDKENLEIKYTSASTDSDSVKILTIHKSKGLEYPVCYFADLVHDFNTKELKEKFICDSKFGLITPVETEEEGDSDSIVKLLYKRAFLKEEISEKIRLFYVALTRAREKFIIVLPNKDTVKLEKNEIGTIELTRRLKFKTLGDFIYGIKDYLPTYFHEVNLNEIGLTKEYLYNKESKTKIDVSKIENFTVEEIDIPVENIEEQRFSKNLPELISKEANDNMEYGTKIHEILEYTDFKNFDPSDIEDEFARSKVSKFISSELLSNVKDAKIFHEYEFIYTKGDIEYHGSIDLMLVYKEHIDIIDYKLKNTTDEHYLDQLNGYKTYIETITNKPVDIYLYSILNESFTKLN